MSTRASLEARFKAFLDKNYPCCGVPGCGGEEEEAKALVEMAYELMRPLSLVEIEERDNPGMMKAARNQIRAEARAATKERYRAASEAAFDHGFTACANEHTKQLADPAYPITRDNPYRSQA